MAAVEWIVTMREGLALLKNNPADVIGIKFEDLSQNPELMLRGLSNFLGLKHDATFLAYGEKTLHPVPDAGKFDLHPLIIDPFNETMKQLGYA